MKRYSIGIDVGGTKTAYGLFDAERRLLNRRRRASDPSLTAEAFFDNIAQNIRELLAEQGADIRDLDGVGIGLPSYIRYADGYIRKTSNLTNLREFAARDYLQGLLGQAVRVLLDNDAHVGALAEHRLGAGRGFDHMLFCPVSTGISSGIIIDNRLFRGSYGWSGESGHMIITPGEGIECGCGNRGCLMSWCSGSMIVRHIRRWIEAGEQTCMTTLAGGAEHITCEHLSAAWEQGDAMAERAVEQMARYLAVWIFNLYVTLNIDCFVFSGGLLQMGERLFGLVRAHFDRYNQDGAHPVHFRKAELGGDAGMIGAVELLFQ